MASMIFNNVYLKDYFTIVGKKEKDSKLSGFNMAIDDYYFGCKTFEDCEIKMQKTVIDNLLKRNNFSEKQIDYLIGGDLINQISITSYNAKDYNIPYIGVYAACATFVLAMINAANLLEFHNAKNIICITSAHNLTAERQFRFPSEYGNSKPHTATCTATGSAGAILTNQKTNFKITSATIGKAIDLGVTDVNHMGAVMAPACADTLHEHLTNLKQKPSDYDLILTGDLGSSGISILKEYYEQVFKERISNIQDAGASMYLQSQEMYAGGSGPICLPLVLFCKILKSKRFKKILILGTGSLHSTVMVNQHKSIPSVCHAVSIEVIS